MTRFNFSIKPFFIFIFLIVFFASTPLLKAEAEFFKYNGTVVQINIEGLHLIEKGLIYSTLSTQQGSRLSPKAVSEDIKKLFNLGFFRDIKVEIEELEKERFLLTFKFDEKPRIGVINIVGNELIADSVLKGVLKVYANNMVNTTKIKTDAETILEEYRKKGYTQTQVDYEIIPIDETSVSLTFRVSESPKVFLTQINISGTKVYPPLDIERLLLSAEVDCFSWANDSGVFQESKINQDLQVITQHYMQNGYIKVNIDKPKVVLIRNMDFSKVVVDFNITEGEQYFTGEIDFISQDGHDLLFDKEEMIKNLTLEKGEIFNPYKQNEDRFKLNDIYLEQGYAFSKIRISNDVHEDTKTVDIKFQITRGEKAYIGRVEIQGNYETMDRVVRRELEIHDNELYNGVKIRESQRKITQLGFFQAGSGVRFQSEQAEDDNLLDYDVLLNEGQTGAFNASLTYSGEGGFSVILSISKKNFLGTGRTLSFSSEFKDQGDSSYNLSVTTPYWLDTKFTNTFKVYNTFEDETYYDIRTIGFSFGLSYPIWKDWSLSSSYAWKDEEYENISSTGEILLDNKEKNSFRSLNLGASYNTVDHPMFPSNGSETSFYADQVGGSVLGGSTEYRRYGLTYRYFKSLNESKTIIFGVKFNWAMLEKSNPDREIPYGKRFTIGGITSVRGFDWNEIKGPASEAELPEGFDIEEKYPYQAEYMADHGLLDLASCNADPVCASLPAEKDPEREYFETHSGGIEKRILNIQLYFPLTREGGNIKGLIFFDAGNVWAEDRMYEITDNVRDDWYYRMSAGAGVNLVTPMGVLRFEYGIKLDKKEDESAGKFDFHISGLF
ncbi:outer membrane protein assembly factor BamA [bacterium]|nr:outer membrane protein assembly factor BamA [bacterium]